MYLCGVKNDKRNMIRLLDRIYRHMGVAAMAVALIISSMAAYAADEFIPLAPSYNDSTMWIVRDNDPKGTGADVFYVVSTWEADYTQQTKVGGKWTVMPCHYADVRNATHREHMSREINGVAAYMAPGNRFYAPFYRHATIEAFLTMNEDSIRRRTRLAMDDVREAFDHFIAQRDPSRPLIIAGFSQGGLAVVELLKHMSDDTYSQLAAAYVLGYKITPEDTMTCKRIKAARGEQDTGVTICYNTVKDVKFIQPVIAATCMGINPVNWRTDATPALLHDTITVTLEPEHHVLVVSGYSGSEYHPYKNFINVGDIHSCEPWLYNDCLRKNFRVRARAWRRKNRIGFQTDSLMVHDPVMAYEDGTYYLLSTGMGLNWATSKDRRTWTVQPTPFIERMPEWTRDSVPGFRGHTWAPDILRWKNRWWLTYSCSTFGRNTSAIGLMSADRLSGPWKDEGCLVASRAKRDEWNAIDPCLIVDESDQLWMTWGSFWDGIQIARLDNRTISQLDNSQLDNSQFTIHNSQLSNRQIVQLSNQKTIARRYARGKETKEPNPTSKYAGPNAIEAPFIMKHDGYYYLFVSWDYCCRGALSNYRVVVGRSCTVDGPYVDRDGKAMVDGGGTLVIEGDKQEFDAAGHCAAYNMNGEDIFICHGYSVALDGASLLIQKRIQWTPDGWPVVN